MTASGHSRPSQLSPWAAPTMVQTGALWTDCAVGLVYIIVLGFIRGTDGPNKYGDDPRAKSPGMVAMPA